MGVQALSASLQEKTSSTKEKWLQDGKTLPEQTRRVESVPYLVIDLNPNSDIQIPFHEAQVASISSGSGADPAT